MKKTLLFCIAICALSRIALGQNSTSSIPLTFSVPGSVAKQGVFLSLFGENVGAATAGSGPFVYAYSGANGSASLTYATTLKTLTSNTTGNSPNATIYVQSVAGFPSGGGNLSVSLPGQQIFVSYTSVNATASPNQFTGVTFADPSGPGIAANATVTLNQNILGPTLSVDSTAGFPASGVLMLQPPPGTVTTPYNVLVSYSGANGTAFTGVQPYPGGGNFTANQSLTSGGPVFLVPTVPLNGNLTVSYLSANQTGVLWDPTLDLGLNVPVINLFADAASLSDNQTYTATVNLPPYVTSGTNTNGIQSGVAVISIGGSVPVTVQDNTGKLGSPTVASAQATIYGVFEWGLVNAAGGLDFDVSEVDQVGFPFTVNTTGTPPPPPADPVLGVGLIQKRADLFTSFSQYINSLPDPVAATAFGPCKANNPEAPWPVDTRITAPQDITGVVLANPPIANTPTASGSSTNSTATAYYAITATNEYGESAVSNSVTQTTTTSNGSLTLSWQPYPYATGYNVYWGANVTSDGASSLISPILIGSTTGAGNTTFTDSSPGSHSGNSTQPPLSNYTYSPLNSYLDEAIKNFFDYFATNTFIMDDQATSTKWTGQVETVEMLGNSYRMLKLLGSNGTWGGQFSGNYALLVEPRFSSNTANSSLPPPPIVSGGAISAINTLQMPFISNGTLVLDQSGNIYSYNGSGSKSDPSNYTSAGTNANLAGMSLVPTQSGSAMAFGAQGVFGNFVGNGTTLSVTNAKNIWNSIVTAIVRGLTPRYISGNWTNIIAPSYWSFSPSMLPPQQSSGGNLSANGTYRYTLTAYGIMGDTSATNETPQSNPATVYLSGSNQTVTINWTAVNPPGSSPGAATAEGFYLYRSQLLANGSWTEPLRLQSLSNNGTVPETSFTDNGTLAIGTETPSVIWYKTDTASNHYAGFFKQFDVSINGLSYGYAYDDKGNTSTNVQMNPSGVTSIVISLNSWSDPVGLPTIEVSGTLNPYATSNGTASAPQSFAASGTNLIGDIAIMAPSGFELALSSSGTYYPSLSLNATGGTVASTSIYARIASSAPVGQLSGNISLTSSNATAQFLAVSGNVTSASAPYQNWTDYWSGQSPSFTGNATAGSADPDGDTFNNDTEFAFGGNPTVPTPSLMSTSVSGGNMTITFVARDTDPPGATYTVQNSTDLTLGFAADPSATVTPATDQSGLQPADQYQRLQFTVPLGEPKEFWRVQATLGE